jgi:hypothetical protein
MNNNELSITCHPGADHAMGHSFADSTVPGIVISTEESPVANTNIGPAEAAGISDMEYAKIARYKVCLLQKGIDSEIDMLIDHSNAGKELSVENSEELLASRYGNSENINKGTDSCQFCDLCDCPESPVNLKYPKLCGYCAHSGYCQDDCSKERVLGILVPCTDYTCREFQTDECRLCAVFTDEPAFVFQAYSCDDDNDIPF